MNTDSTPILPAGSYSPARVSHSKTGNRYVSLGQVLDCTNSRDGTRVVLYQRADGTPERFVREAGEFAEKFASDVSDTIVRLADAPPAVPCRHKKTGNAYLFLGEVLDCTNSRNGTRAALYQRADDATQPMFVRELAEFWDKFELVYTGVLAN